MMEPMESTVSPNVRRKRPWRFSLPIRITAIVGAVLLIVVGVLATGVGFYADYYIRNMLSLITYDDGSQDYSDVPLLPPDENDGSVDNVIEDTTPVDIDSIQLRGNTKDITNVLLLGIDGRASEGYTTRSDTNMILSVNTAAETVKLASLLRDTWVTIPDRDWNGDGYDDYDKLNVAFYYGGFKLLSDTIAQNFKIRIDKYVAVDFIAFEKAVDAMGGVDIELTADEAMFIPQYSDDPDKFCTPDNPELSPLGYEGGVYHLNGQQTLAYCRIRGLYYSSDFQRQQNQRKVIEQLLEKAKSMNFGTITSVLEAVLPYVQTNMTQQELLDYASQALQYIGFDIYSDFSVPSAEYADFENGWIGDGLGLWLTDPEASTLRLHQYLYETEVSDE